MRPTLKYCCISGLGSLLLLKRSCQIFEHILKRKLTRHAKENTIKNEQQRIRNRQTRIRNNQKPSNSTGSNPIVNFKNPPTFGAPDDASLNKTQKPFFQIFHLPQILLHIVLLQKCSFFKFTTDLPFVKRTANV